MVIKHKILVPLHYLDQQLSNRSIFFRDTAVGLITGAMAIPLSIDIAIMSDYPIKVGLATVVFACLIGWINAWFEPGNFIIGAPGIAAGLAPAFTNCSASLFNDYCLLVVNLD